MGHCTQQYSMHDALVDMHDEGMLLKTHKAVDAKVDAQMQRGIADFALNASKLKW